jgi:Cu(I)/Ag(I) efflux system membrane fusion protein
VRIEFDNAEGLLKPDMFGDVAITANAARPGLFVPREALLITGKKTHLFVQTEPGHFEPRTVITGTSSEDQVEILEGVKDGELIVTSGQFLIDSESSIREAAAKMVAPKQPEQPAAQGMQMDGMDMKGMDMNEIQMDGMDMNNMEMGEGKGVRRE